MPNELFTPEQVKFIYNLLQIAYTQGQTDAVNQLSEQRARPHSIDQIGEEYEKLEEKRLQELISKTGSHIHIEKQQLSGRDRQFKR